MQDRGYAILVNGKAAAGRGFKRWQRIANEKPIKELDADIFFVDQSVSKEESARWLLDHLKRGSRKFIAVGGDGTVNFLLNLIIKHINGKTRLSEISLGAIGIGSSNDFHKPFSYSAKHCVKKYPCKLDFSEVVATDVLFALNRTTDSVHYFLVNASAGITAEANDLFNRLDSQALRLKSLNAGIAILYSALKTMFAYKNTAVTLETGDSVTTKCELTNLGIIKNPHFSGSFRYNRGALPGSGDFLLHLSYNMGMFEALRTLCHLARGRFEGLPKTITRATRSLRMRSVLPICFEMDGEVSKTSDVEIGVLGERIQVCR